MHGFSRDEETILQRVAPYIAPPRNPDMLRLIPPLLFALVAFGALIAALDETDRRDAPGTALVEALARIQAGEAR